MNSPTTQAYSFPALIQQAPLSARFEHPDYFTWCGSAVRGGDGRYHLFFSRWHRKHGFNAWVSHSEVARATAESPYGPYEFQEVVLPARGAGFWDGSCTHNPTVQQFGGRYYLYYMGNRGDGLPAPRLNWTHRNNQRIGVAVADAPEGPWTRFDEPLIAPTPGFGDGLCVANPSVTARPGGGYLMIYKGVDVKAPLPFGGPVKHFVALASDPTGPYTKQPGPIFDAGDEPFPAEDPFVWSAGGKYFAIVKDMGGFFTGCGRSLALFESADGLDWQPAPAPLVSTTEVLWENGVREPLEALERPQLLFDDAQNPVALLCAAAVPGYERTFNVQIPLSSTTGA